LASCCPWRFVDLLQIHTLVHFDTQSRGPPHGSTGGRVPWMEDSSGVDRDWQHLVGYLDASACVQSLTESRLGTSCTIPRSTKTLKHSILIGIWALILALTLTTPCLVSVGGLFLSSLLIASSHAGSSPENVPGNTGAELDSSSPSPTRLRPSIFARLETSVVRKLFLRLSSLAAPSGLFPRRSPDLHTLHANISRLFSGPKPFPFEIVPRSERALTLIC